MIDKNVITIGVELEFLVCDLPVDFQHFKEFDLVVDALKPMADKLGVQVFQTAIITTPGMCPSQSELFECFHVQDDGTIQPSSPTQRGVEVATPILRNRTWETVIPAMCKALQTTFKIRCNSSTGLHVHIGIGQPYTFQHLKRFSKAVILFEDQMDNCHPVWRSGDQPSEGAGCYIKSCRNNRIFRYKTNPECMKIIDTTFDADDLLAMVNCHPIKYDSCDKYYKYNLTNTWDYKTIEFRQAAGTVNADKILDWIRRVIMFVDRSISTSNKEFEDWSRIGVNDPKIYEQFGVPVPKAFNNTIDPVTFPHSTPLGWGRQRG
ncbi:hypothetical protein Q9L58_001313 [Maublancomyces gigas]|uniref:Amidoligase enzyme n=1 Tax=Discina gigas TaxID=1032678 RepID=A0ABR3GVX3_9PEZI